jgi:miniconductance mechanosensitive channel
MRQALANSIDRIGDWIASSPTLAFLLGVSVVLVLAGLVFLVTRRYLLRLIAKGISKTKLTWDDALLGQRVLHRAALLAPILVVYYGVALIPYIPQGTAAFVVRVALAAMVLVVVLTLGALLGAVNQIYSDYPVSKDLPIKGYLQIVSILVYVLGGILVVALLLDRSPWFFMTGLGAMTAVLMLVFRDTILSLVASVQLLSNDMVRIGDWVEMPKYGADGDVVDVALHTVKIQNFDKTITAIPTYKMIADSFKNWRGMKESGGRRIKRSISLDMNSVRFLTPSDIERFSGFELLADYMGAKRRELEEYNREHPQGGTVANSRRLTNIGTFRAWVVAYLRQHQAIDDEGMTFLVRQLDPGPEGLPLQVYVFARETAWVAYEGIQADIFDHVLAMVPEFGLRAFQNPAGLDIRDLAGKAAAPDEG